MQLCLNQVVFIAFKYFKTNSADFISDMIKNDISYSDYFIIPTTNILKCTTYNLLIVYLIHLYVLVGYNSLSFNIDIH